MNDVLLEWIGYIASLVVLVSLLMSSIKKLRWINLVGATLFGFYGFMIGSIPTGMMNFGIVLIDIYFLVRMYQTNDFFKAYPISGESQYYDLFVDFYNNDIRQFNNVNLVDIKNAKVKLFILRNMAPAGLFIADEVDPKTLEIKLDYVIPQYRDFKTGKFVFDSQKENFKDMGYERFVVNTENKDHMQYIKKMGFTLDEESKQYYKAI